MRTVISLLLFVCICRASIDLSTFENHTTFVDDIYDVYWNISGEYIVLALNVATPGWIGFAIGEQTSGSMPGADYVTGWVDDESLEASIQDRFAVDYVMPTVDTCQDWELVDSDQSVGKTTLVVKRLLKTSDNQDRTIVAGPMRVLYAFGKSDTFSYHGTTRALTSIEFIKPSNALTPSDNGPNVITHEILMQSSQIPEDETTYLCQTFKLPDVLDGQIIQIDPVVEIHPSAPNLVHHFEAFACYANESNWNVYPFPQPCDDMMACMDVIYAWAPGASPVILPKDVGFRIGQEKSYAFRYVLLQIHYNNINHYSGLSDNSGMRIHYTTNATRPYDAGVMVLGDALVDQPPLAAGKKAVEVEVECPSECTSKFSHDITVIFDGHHMHQVGSQIWNTHWRDGNMTIENRADFYNFGLQYQAPVNYTFKRGDSMHVHCVYNTMGHSKPVNFGRASSDEMCMNFLTYYPILETEHGPFGMCGNVKRDGEQVVACGAYYDPNLVPEPRRINPPNPDPPGTGTVAFGKSCETSPPVPSMASQSRVAGILSPILCIIISVWLSVM